MSNATRTHEAGRDPKSFVVFQKAGEYGVKGSHWAVGYTPAYAATPQEAVDFAIEQKAQQIEALQQEARTLVTLRSTLDVGNEPEAADAGELNLQ